MATTMVLSRGGLNPLLAVAGGAGLLTGWLMGPMLREMGRVRVDVGPPPVPLKAEETTDQPQAPPAVGERPSNPPVSLPTDQELPKGELVPRPKDAAPPATETTDAPPVEETDDGPTTGEGSRPDVGQEPTSGPSQPPKDITGPIIGTATEQLGERLVDVLRSEGSIAPNGVPRIVKREWSPDEYKAWFDSLPNQPAKTNTSADIYQIIHAGDTVYTISGGGVEFDADGIRDRTVLEVKFIGDPERSPYVEGSKFPDFIRYRDGGPDAKTRGEFERMGKILRDNNNPLTSVRLITSDPRAVPYFERLMREYNVPGEIIVDTRTDIVDDDQR
jgi:hypothetical protein